MDSILAKAYICPGIPKKVADSTRIPEKKAADSSRIPGKKVAGILLTLLGFRDSGFPGL